MGRIPSSLFVVLPLEPFRYYSMERAPFIASLRLADPLSLVAFSCLEVLLQGSYHLMSSVSSK
jgi:hypothetical protein